MKFLKVFILSLCISSICSLNHSFLSIKPRCTESFIASVRAKQIFLSREHTTTFVGLSNAKLEVNIDCGIDVYQPMEFFQNKSKIKFEIVPTSALSGYPLTRGYLLMGKYDEIMSFLKKLSKHNNQQKVLLMLADEVSDKGENMLKIAFEKFKMLQLAVLTYTPQDQFFCMRNPFSGNLTVRKPEFKCWSMKNYTTLQSEIKEFMTNRILNLQKYPLNIDLYEQMLFCKINRDRDGNVKSITYPSCELVNFLAQKLNFQPVLKIYDNLKGDHMTKNGSWVGSIGNLENDELNIDFAANFRDIADYKNVKKIIFLQPLMSVNHKFIIRRRESHFETTFKVAGFSDLDTYTDFFVAGLLLMFPILLIVAKKLESRICDLKPTDGSVMTTIAILFSVSIKHPRGNAIRLILFCIIFFNFIFASFFQSSLTKNLEVVSKKSKIQKISQLIDEGYELKIPMVVKDIYMNHYGSKISEIMRGIAFNKTKDDLTIHTFVDGMNYVLTQKDKKIAMLSISAVVKGVLNLYSDKENHENLIETVPETIGEFSIAPMTRRDSHFISQFNKLILRFNELGFQKYFFDKALSEEHFDIAAKTKRKKSETFISLKDLFPLFTLYISLITLSIVVFIGELLWNSITNKKAKKTKKMTKTKNKVEIIYPYLP